MWAATMLASKYRPCCFRVPTDICAETRYLHDCVLSFRLSYIHLRNLIPRLAIRWTDINFTTFIKSLLPNLTHKSVPQICGGIDDKSAQNSHSKYQVIGFLNIFFLFFETSRPTLRSFSRHKAAVVWCWPSTPSSVEVTKERLHKYNSTTGRAGKNLPLFSFI